jgi:hypothetical protein
MRRRVCTARGAALVETVTALALISLTVVTMLLMASRHRTQTRLDLVIRSDVETIKGQPYSATASYSLPAPPAPFTSATFTVLYYNPTGCGGFCATAPSPDSGLQWLTITVNGPGVSETVSLFKEKL